MDYILFMISNYIDKNLKYLEMFQGFIVVLQNDYLPFLSYRFVIVM